MEIKVVPIISYGTLEEAIRKTQEGFNSIFGNFVAEGIVLKPLIELRDRHNHRIITKVKYKDWK